VFAVYRCQSSSGKVGGRLFEGRPRFHRLGAAGSLLPGGSGIAYGYPMGGYPAASAKGFRSIRQGHKATILVVVA
jgi:hypothetical protein